MSEGRSPRVPPVASLHSHFRAQNKVVDGVIGKQRHSTEEPCGTSVFPTGRNPSCGKHLPPTEIVSTASLFPTFAGDKPVGLPRGAQTCLRPWRLDFFSARGDEARFCPWHLFPRARHSAICPLIVQPFGKGLAKAQPQQDPLATDPVPAQREARMEAEPGPSERQTGNEEGSRARPSLDGQRESKQALSGRQTG